MARDIDFDSTANAAAAIASGPAIAKDPERLADSARPHHHHADEVFTSWGMETVRTYGEEELRQILEKLSNSEEYGIILRAKGMLKTESKEWLYFDLVPEEYEIRKGQPTYTGRFCVIGSKLEEDKLKELFHAE